MIIVSKWFTGLFKIRGITLFPFIIVSSRDAILLNHERIHYKQCIKYWIVGFYLKYLYEAITKGYANISFEIEAYAHEKDLTYKIE